MDMITMTGWETARHMAPAELRRVMDAIAMQDLRDGTQLAPLWRSHTGQAMVCDCRDGDAEARPGAYFLQQMPALLCEGLCIAGRAAEAKALYVAAEPEQVTEAGAQLALWPEITVCSGTEIPRGLCHSAETFVRLARLFRREGAEKRLCCVSSGSLPPRYLEVPLTYTLRQIAQLAGVPDSTGAVVENTAQPHMDLVPALGSCPRIHFVQEEVGTAS